MSAKWVATSDYDYNSLQPTIRIGKHEITPDVLDNMLETAEFIQFLRAHDLNWEQLWQAYKVTKRLEQK
jgi:hypothetical protein